MAVTGLNGQVTILSQGFEVSCANASNAFYTGCVPGWISTNGTPDIKSDYSGVTPFEGQKYAHMYVHERWDCSPTDRGEGIALNQNFVAGTTYYLSFALRSYPGSTKTVKWVLTGGRANNTGDSNSCSAGEVTPAIMETDEVVWQASNYQSSSWQTFNISFTPTTNHTQLWFRASNYTPSPLNDDILTHLFLDGVGLQYDPNDCMADFEILPGDNCTYYLFNTSTPSSADCPSDCQSPIPVTKWSVTDLQDPYARVVSGNSYNMVFTPSCNGYYMVCLTIEDCTGCVHTTCKYLYVNCTMCTCQPGPDPCVGANDPNSFDSQSKNLTGVEEFSIYPNPATTKVEIETKYQRVSEKPLAIEVFDMYGKVVRTDKIDRDEIRKTLNINDLPAGVYMIRISEDGVMLHTEKLLIGK